jgi:hypothetical protein
MILSIRSGGGQANEFILVLVLFKMRPINGGDQTDGLRRLFAGSFVSHDVM